MGVSKNLTIKVDEAFFKHLCINSRYLSKRVCQYWSRKSTATTGAGKNLREEDVENNITLQNIIKPSFEDDMN